MSETFTLYGSNIANVWQEIFAPMTLAFSCEIVHEKLCKSVNICKSYSKKISGTFFSWTRCIYKGQWDPMDCSSHRGIKLLEHGMKAAERVLVCRLRQQVKTDECGFVEAKCTAADEIFTMTADACKV